MSDCKPTSSQVIDKGSQGVIWQVRSKQTMHVYACKTISKSKLKDAPEEMEAVRREVQASGPQLAAANVLQREAICRRLQILRHLSGHPNLVNVKEVYEDRRELHIVMELCEGGELFQVGASGKRPWGVGDVFKLVGMGKLGPVS